MNKKEFDKKVRDFVDITVFGTGETIFSDMIIFSRETWECIEQYGKEARIDELQLLLTNTNVNQIKDENILKRIKELKDE